MILPLVLITIISSNILVCYSFRYPYDEYLTDHLRPHYYPRKRLYFYSSSEESESNTGGDGSGGGNPPLITRPTAPDLPSLPDRVQAYVGSGSGDDSGGSGGENQVLIDKPDVPDVPDRVQSYGGLYRNRPYYRPNYRPFYQRRHYYRPYYYPRRRAPYGWVNYGSGSGDDTEGNTGGGITRPDVPVQPDKVQSFGGLSSNRPYDDYNPGRLVNRYLRRNPITDNDVDDRYYDRSSRILNFASSSLSDLDDDSNGKLAQISKPVSPIAPIAPDAPVPPFQTGQNTAVTGGGSGKKRPGLFNFLSQLDKQLIERTDNWKEFIRDELDPVQRKKNDLHLFPTERYLPGFLGRD